MNGGALHNGDSARGDIDGGRMDGFVRTAEQQGGRGCGATAPICASNAPPDVMGYHDAREIPNYWRWAHDFTLQDHMFEPTASWSLPAHLFMVSGWSARCTRGGDPTSCVNDDELGGFKTAQITGKPGADGPATNAAAALRAVTRCLERHGVRRAAVRARPAGAARARRAGPVPSPRAARGGQRGCTEYGNYAWTDLTWLMHMHHVSWRYYIHKGDCAPENMRRARRPRSGTRCRRSPTSAATVRPAT